MSDNAFIVPPLSRIAIRHYALAMRRVLSLEDVDYIPIPRVFEILPNLIPDFVFHVLSREEMGARHGLKIPGQNAIAIREDVYDRACRGLGRDRLTMAHELGHLILHSDAALARPAPGEEVPAFRSSEWQANAFGGEFLVSAKLVGSCGGPQDIGERFGVSGEAADIQWNVFEREGIVARKK